MVESLKLKSGNRTTAIVKTPWDTTSLANTHENTAAQAKAHGDTAAIGKALWRAFYAKPYPYAQMVIRSACLVRPISTGIKFSVMLAKDIQYLYIA